MLEVFDCEQGSPDWHQCRLGIPTASEFSTVLAKGKDGGASITRAKYLRTLAAEILTGELEPDSYTNVHMERGKVQEDEAREMYAFMVDEEPQRVGFIRNGNAGASPDSLIGSDGGLEIKTALRHIQIDRLQRGVLPPEHRAQVQGCMWIAERGWWDFVSYAPKLPPLIVRVERDDEYIATLSAAVDAFNSELAEVVEKVRRYGLPDALAA